MLEISEAQKTIVMKGKEKKMHQEHKSWRVQTSWPNLIKCS